MERDCEFASLCTLRTSDVKTPERPTGSDSAFGKGELPSLGAKRRRKAAARSQKGNSAQLRTWLRTVPSRNRAPLSPKISINSSLVWFWGAVPSRLPVSCLSPACLPPACPPSPAQGRALTRGAERPLRRSYLPGGRG